MLDVVCDKRYKFTPPELQQQQQQQQPPPHHQYIIGTLGADTTAF
jgi:hypothetical protein